jgi:glycosyltransferase involved in cell wall biosynthesis
MGFKTMSHPSIAAVMPVRNAANFLKSSLASISANIDYLDEVIIVDDGSTDSSSKILRAWVRDYPKAQLLTTSGVGLVKSLNLAMSVVQSEFVARFDADDLYDPRRIALQSSAILPEIVGVFCDYSIFSDSGRKMGFIPSPIFPDETAISLIRSQRTPHPGVIFNVHAARSVGGYQVEDFPAEDLSLWLRLSRVGSLVSVPETLLSYRLSSKSISSSHSSEMIKKRNQLLDEVGLNPNSLRGAVEKLESFEKSYLGVSHSEVRRIIHLLELRAAVNKTNFQGYSSKIAYRVLRECLKPSAAKNMSFFTFQTLERRIQRNYLLK